MSTTLGLNYGAMQSVQDLKNRDYTGSVASPTIESRYANIFVFIDCENNQFLKK